MWGFGSGIALAVIIMATAAAKRGDMAPNSRAALWFIAGGGLLFGLGPTWSVAAQLARRLDAVRDALGQVGDGDLTVSVPGARRWRSHATIELRGIDCPVEVFSPEP